MGIEPKVYGLKNYWINLIPFITIYITREYILWAVVLNLIHPQVLQGGSESKFHC